MQVSSVYHNYSTSFVFLNVESVERKGKIQKFEYLENENSFLDEITKNFIVFEELPFGEKIKT